MSQLLPTPSGGQGGGQAVWERYNFESQQQEQQKLSGLLTIISQIITSSLKMLKRQIFPG